MYSRRKSTTAFPRRQTSAVTMLRVAVGVATVLAGATPAAATPFNYGEGVAPLRWPANKTISIFIEADPVATPPDCSALLAAGMMRWAAVMAPRGITITVTVGEPPDPPPTNVVRCTYEADGTHHPNDPKGEGPALGDENDGIGGCSGPAGGNIDSGAIIVRTDLWAASGTDAMGNPNGLTDVEREEYIRNLGAHEITHVLGLADDAAGSVTNHLQNGTGPAPFNDRDRREINTLYPLLGQQAPRAHGQRQPNPDPNFHNYNFQYQGLPNDHVPLITLDIPAHLIVQVNAPPGWVVLNPADPNRTNRNHPFYQNFLEDGRPSPAPYDAAATPALALRAVGLNPGLTTSNPTFGFVVITQGAELGTIPVWAGGQVQALPGPVAPNLAIGDMNCDGIVSVSDIAGFVLALTNPPAYLAQFPNCDISNGDINGSGSVTVSDIGPFVTLLTGQ